MSTYNYTYYPLSKENTYFIMSIYHYRDKIFENISLSRNKMITASMHLKTPDWYNKATFLIIQEILLHKIVNKTRRALDKIKDYDIIFSKVEGKTNGHGYERQFFRDRNLKINQLAYRLAQQGLSDLRVNKEFKPYFNEFLEIARDMKIRENKRKKEGLNNG